jgi:hypothetical protein
MDTTRIELIERALSDFPSLIRAALSCAPKTCQA